MRLIDADELINDIQYNLWDWQYLDGITATTVLKQTITDIKNEPTIDAVPVVRCFECKAFTLKAEKPRYTCYKVNGLNDPKPNDYCSYGERICDDADQ